MGLLDSLNSDEGMQALGLLAAAGPSATPMSFGQRLFGAMQQDQARRTEAEDRKMRLQMQQMQMQQMLLQQETAKRAAQRQATLEALPGQFMQPGMKPETMDNRDVGQPGEAPIPKTQFDLGGYANELFRYDPLTALQLRTSMQKDNKRTTLKAGETVFDESGKPLFGLPAAPDKQEQSPIAKLMAEMNALPPGSPMRAVYQNAITKATTHQPGVSVSYGQPVAGVDASGNPVFFQPAKGGGAPAIVPGVKPAPQNRDTKLPAELQRMQIAGDSMVQLMDDYEGLLKKHNPRDPMVQMNPTIRADMQSLKRNIELQFKELQALGALAGPDIEIIRQSLSDPFSMSGAFYGRDGLLSQVKRSRDLVRIRAQAVQSSQGKPPPAAGAAPPENSDPLGLRGN